MHAEPNLYPIRFADEPHKKYMLTEKAWAAHVGCDDQPKGKIGLFSLLHVLASIPNHDVYGYPLSNPEESTILQALREADPTQKFWHLQVNRHGLHSVWRRKEWAESMDKQASDAEKKKIALVTQAEYAHAKEVVMEFLMLMCDDDKRMAEKMFYSQGFANDQQRLIKKAASLSGMKERQATAVEEERSPEQMSKFESLRLKLKGK